MERVVSSAAAVVLVIIAGDGREDPLPGRRDGCGRGAPVGEVGDPLAGPVGGDDREDGLGVVARLFFFLGGGGGGWGRGKK